MAYTYPASDLDKSKKLLSLLGSFWTHVYQGRDLLEHYLVGRAELERQNLVNAVEGVFCASRFNVPIYHTENWYLLILRTGERLPTAHTYGETGLAYGGGASYGGSTAAAWTLPAGLVTAPIACSRIADPAVVLVEGADYTIADGVITFGRDPFQNALLAQRPVFTDGVETDRELALWLYGSKFDRNFIYDHWGYIAGLRLAASSAGYRDLVNALLDALVDGSTRSRLEAAFQAMTGIHLARTDGEVVEATTEDASGTLVLTDREVYRFRRGVTVLVQVGDTLRAGDRLVDGLEVVELNRGTIPSGLTGLAVGRGLLLGDYAGEIVFPNREVPIEVATESEYTKVTFTLDGFPLDVTAFWDAVHVNGIAAGQTLAHLLDQRTNKVGEPVASNLPATINPMQFLIENLLRHNAYLVRIKVSAMATTGVGLSAADALRRYLPPHTALLVVVELPTPTEVLKLDGDGPTAAKPGATSSLDSFDGATTLSGTISTELFVSSVARAWAVSGDYS